MVAGTRDVLGHRAVVDALWGALRADTLHHAYLFEGPRGVGKATVASRLAMAANCTEPADDPPCGRCPTCRSIAAGTHPDVIRLEPASDRATPIIPVDDVREVVRLAGYRRYGSRRRFILVDPAEALQPAAANALLKTLEEPHPGTGFVLIASQASALLPTILSRCQRVRFGAVPEAETAAWLAQRLPDLGDPRRAARLAQGCPGVALALAEGKLAERLELRGALLTTLAGPLGGIFDWTQSLTAGSRPLYAERVATLVEVIVDLLADAVVHATGASRPLLDEDIPDVVAAWATALWPEGITRMQQALDDLDEDLEVNVSARTAFDALLTRLRHELGPAAVRAGAG